MTTIAHPPDSVNAARLGRRPLPSRLPAPLPPRPRREAPSPIRYVICPRCKSRHAAGLPCPKCALRAAEAPNGLHVSFRASALSDDPGSFERQMAADLRLGVSGLLAFVACLCLLLACGMAVCQPYFTLSHDAHHEVRR